MHLILPADCPTEIASIAPILRDNLDDSFQDAIEEAIRECAEQGFGFPKFFVEIAFRFTDSLWEELAQFLSESRANFIASYSKDKTLVLGSYKQDGPGNEEEYNSDTHSVVSDSIESLYQYRGNSPIPRILALTLGMGFENKAPSIRSLRSSLDLGTLETLIVYNMKHPDFSGILDEISTLCPNIRVLILDGFTRMPALQHDRQMIAPPESPNRQLLARAEVDIFEPLRKIVSIDKTYPDLMSFFLRLELSQFSVLENTAVDVRFKFDGTLRARDAKWTEDVRAEFALGVEIQHERHHIAGEDGQGI
ncbi:hypothetical protein Dda_7069 [Drechslerella dactyloides]|uniref:Uncharacterized protein n=1 Tax=Drechslerella dactyloides TaxID=74499 RepID=A0AAD6ITM3_DREDA|nr:hypothetical protein Dda_7069 [Drechslerella dactyloides]